jgi:hypothetical protein
MSKDQYRKAMNFNDTLIEHIKKGMESKEPMNDAGMFIMGKQLDLTKVLKSQNRLFEKMLEKIPDTFVVEDNKKSKKKIIKRES